jgi:hypothetical protein
MCHNVQTEYSQSNPRRQVTQGAQCNEAHPLQPQGDKGPAQFSVTWQTHWETCLLPQSCADDG